MFCARDYCESVIPDPIEPEVKPFCANGTLSKTLKSRRSYIRK